MHQSSRRFLLWLAATTFIMAIAMAVLLAVVLGQSRAFEDNAKNRLDSITSLTFQLEREFLRLRDTIAGVARGEPMDAQTLGLRYDIFLSRISLLRENITTENLRQRDEYRQVMPQLDRLIQQAEPILNSPTPQREQVASLLRPMQDMGADVQSLSFAANSVVAAMLERQSATVRQQNRLIIGLTVAQLLLLLITAAALAVRHRRQVREAQAMEALNAELHQARITAENASRGKSQFLANMSHELRTPFNGFLGMLNLLEQTSPTPTQQDYLDTARQSAQHLLSLLNDILDVSAMEAGKLRLNPAAIDLHRVLDDVYTLMHSQAVAKGLQLEFHRAPEVPRWLRADVTRLKQILFNLLSNAIKFTEHGTVTLSAEAQVSADGPVLLRVEVRDTGIGMDEATQAQLFQRFYQLDMSASRRFGGTGLGLEISRALARMMAGDLEVSSQPGMGSVFTLSLQLDPCAEPVINTEATATPHLLSKSDVSLRILVAEDHPVNQKFIDLVLKRMGHEGIFVVNGQLALDRVQQESFDLILMDLHMPVMDGLEATRSIRALPGEVSALPIFALTADVLQETRESAWSAGVDDFLTKPLQLAHLERVIADRHDLSRRRLGRSKPADQAARN